MHRQPALARAVTPKRSSSRPTVVTCAAGYPLLMNGRRTTGATAVAAAVAFGLAGCGTVHGQAVMSTVDHFYADLDSGDGGAACALLAPGTRSELEQSEKKPCDRAILEEGVTRPGVRRGLQVFGTMAQVR